MSIVLNERQVLFYQHTVSLWEPTSQGMRDSDKTMLDIAWVVKYANVPCYVQMTPEENFPTAIGRTKEQNVFTLDRINLSADQEIQDGWGVLFTLQGHPQFGKWWIVQGNTQTIAATSRRATNFAHTLLQRETRPAQIA